MKLYLLRSGIAAESTAAGDEDDAQRSLTQKGREKIAKVATVLKLLNISPDVILASPYQRARETAEIVAKELKYKKSGLAFGDFLLPMAAPEELIPEIIEKYLVEELLLVGHEPSLGRLLGLLISGNSEASVNLRHGSVCSLSVDDLRIDHRATLEWLLPPKIYQKI